MLSYPAIIEIVIILISAFLSFKTTESEIRRENHFTWGAIQEVAVLFIGIFHYHAASSDAFEGQWS